MPPHRRRPLLRRHLPVHDPALQHLHGHRLHDQVRQRRTERQQQHRLSGWSGVPVGQGHPDFRARRLLHWYGLNFIQLFIEFDNNYLEYQMPILRVHMPEV